MAAKKPDTSKAEKALKKVQAKAAPKNKAPAKRKAPRKTTPKIDWTAALQDYLTDGFCTYKDIAEKYKVSVTAVEKHASAAGWVDLRSRLGEQATNLIIKKLATKKAQANDRHLSNYTVLTQKVMLAIDKLSAESDTGDIVALAKALKVAQDGERVVLGLPTHVNAITGKDGDNVWNGFADMVKAAHDVVTSKEGGDGSGTSSPDTGTS